MRAVEECERLYGSLKFAVHTQHIPAAKEKNLNDARESILKILEIIGTGE